MNREIKFRAWDKTFKKMISWNEFLQTNMANTFISPKSTGLTLMQYTGLKDKNGVEIYEGDIVAIQFDLTSIKSKVLWLQEISGFIVEDVSILDNNLAQRIVVIGNVWENGDLLNDSKKAKED